MITSETRGTEDHSGDEDVLVLENHPNSFQNKQRTAQSGLVEQSKRVYYLLSSSQSDDEEIELEGTVEELCNENKEACMKAEYAGGTKEHEKDETSSPPNDDHKVLSTNIGQLPEMPSSEQAKQSKVMEELDVLQRDNNQIRKSHDLECHRSSYFDPQKRHLDDDTSFFFRGHNISEGIKRAVAMHDSTDTRQQSKSKRKHHNLDVDEIGNGKSEDRHNVRSSIGPVLGPKSEEGVRNGVSSNDHVGSLAPMKYDATYDPEFAKLMAKYTMRGITPSSSQPQWNVVKPILQLKSVCSPVPNSLNINIYYQKDGKVATLLFACEMNASFGDISEALHHRLRINFTLMYKKAPILSSLATPEALNMEKGSVIEAFDDFALGALKTLQEKDEIRRKELLEAERLASASTQLEDTDEIPEGDQDDDNEQVGNSLWTMCVRINAKQTESVQINPEDTVSRLLCLVLEKMERPGSSAVLIWDGMALPEDAIIRDADLEDGDQLELHFRPT